MFELSVARKYLIPKKGHLSSSLIGVMSIFVISVVVWLLLIFLSVTEGIEKNWLKKLTSLHAPIQITPTNEYYNSYYYLADSVAEASGYANKNIKEKLLAQTSDPYQPSVDSDLPSLFPKPDRKDNGSLKDPVKEAFSLLQNMQTRHEGFVYQDFEVTGALLKLELVRGFPKTSKSILTQASYISSFSEENPNWNEIFIEPENKDISHLLYQNDQEVSFVQKILTNLEIQKVQIPRNKRVPTSLLENGMFVAFAEKKNGKISAVFLPQDVSKNLSPGLEKGTLVTSNQKTTFINEKKEVELVDAPVFLDAPAVLDVKQTKVLHGSKNLAHVAVEVLGTIQGKSCKGTISLKEAEILATKYENSFDNIPENPPKWLYKVAGKFQIPALEDSKGVILGKTFQENGVMIGDKGHLCFSSQTTSSLQEQKTAITVVGFYDPGVMAVGNRSIIVSPDVAKTIGAAQSQIFFDKTASNGIRIWLSDLNQAKDVKKEIEDAFQKAGIDKYWKVTSFHEYDFAKDLLTQFQSDRYLFTLVGIIILFVACSNILSLLIMLVNDKKKEIGILLSMGASARSIATIFGICGIFLGIIGCIIGIGSAALTLANLDGIVKALSFLQGHEMFNPAFYGNSLPKELSTSALNFILLATPLIALVSGIFPALKAARLQPSEILRG